MLKIKAIIPVLYCLLLAFLPACGTLEISLDQTPTPDVAGRATVAALSVQNAALATQVANFATNYALDAQTEPEAVRLRMLNSHTYWKTIWADATITYNLPAQSEDEPVEAQETHQQIWVDHWNGKYRLLTAGPENNPVQARISDGETQVELDVNTGRTRTSSMPEFARQAFNAPQVLSDTIYPHPLSGQLGTPLADGIFPTSLAQRSGFYTVIREEEVAGRKAVVVEYRREEAGSLIDRFWVDAETGVILRWQNYGKEGSDTPSTDMLLNQIEFDVPIPLELFNVRIGEPPRFAKDYAGTPLEMVRETPSTEIQPGSGELYFVINNLNDGTLQLVHLPGTCLISGTPCPQPDPISDFPNRNTMVIPLYWSPDGTMAVLPSANTPSELYRYIPSDESWTRLAEFDHMYDIVHWSPDGGWIAVVAARSNIEDIYLLRPDGSVQNLTQGLFPDLAERHFWMLGWLDNKVLFSLPEKGQPNTVYALEPRAGTEASVEPEDLTAGGFPKLRELAVSPDQNQIAYIDENENGLTIVGVMDSDGNSQKRLASFQGSSVWNPRWSLDGEWISFQVTSGQDLTHINAIYAVRKDGTDLRQVYQNEDILAYSFAPDSLHMAIQGGSAGSGTHIFIASLDGGEAQIIQAPGLRLDTEWMGVSWRNIE